VGGVTAVMVHSQRLGSAVDGVRREEALEHELVDERAFGRQEARQPAAAARYEGPVVTGDLQARRCPARNTFATGSISIA